MGKRIMIVDDSRAQAFQVKGLLEDTDYEVAACCQTGEEALAEYSVIQPDLITMDIIMPGMDGLETAQAILEGHPEAKIVMISSLDYEDTRKEASDIGAKAFLNKPFTRDDLISTLDRVMNE
ncbi:MAG: response regulator [Oscillospiraceae bacterium]|nr:response regulator [Oscillospiraceae bacterium]